MREFLISWQRKLGFFFIPFKKNWISVNPLKDNRLKSDKDLVFIGGLFRSDTSLLSSVLNQNPALALMYECDIWNLPQNLLAYECAGTASVALASSRRTVSEQR